jgi:hypothetical protein
MSSEKNGQRLRSALEDLPGVQLEGPTGYEKFRQLPALGRGSRSITAELFFLNHPADGEPDVNGMSFGEALATTLHGVYFNSIFSHFAFIGNQ